MNDTTRPTSIGRTWAITCFDRYEASGSIVGRSIHIVTLTANAEVQLSALVDLEETTLDRAVMLLRWAKTDGTYEQISELRLPESQPVAAEVAVIGKAVACELHRELGRLGYRAHYALAGEVLNRVVPSLTAITADERNLVREYA